MHTPPQAAGHLVLVGGGHAQVAVLKALASNPLAGLATTLVSRDINTPYSGMLPGFVEGVWNEDDIHIDLARLARMAGASFINAAAVDIDPDARKIQFDGRAPVTFDMLSLNIGGEPDLAAIEGAAQHCIPVKPISRFRQRLARLTSGGYPERIAVIGGGTAGCELALALSRRWLAATGKRARVTIFGRSGRLMPEHPPRAARLIYESLVSAGCRVVNGHSVVRVEDGRLVLDDGSLHEFDACFLVTAVSPPAWMAHTGLELDGRGFVKVGRTLQSTSHPHVFASGDIAQLSWDPRPKAGVYAVRAGPVLAENIRRYALGKRLVRWRPQRNALAIIGTADGSAIAIRGASVGRSRFWWWWKKRIDRIWMEQYTVLSMPMAPAPPELPGLARDAESAGNAAEPGARASSPAAASQANAGGTSPLPAMRCLGCGAKTGHESLANALREAVATALVQGADQSLMPPMALGEDAAVLPVPEGGELIQSIDVISAIVSDPYLLGRIAALHAMSDIYAANAVPVWAMASVTLSPGRLELEQAELTQLMTGGLMALAESGAQLVGGHTSQGDATQIGYSITGWRDGAPQAPGKNEEPVLLLTKPLGIGIVMAAHMELEARGVWVDVAIRTMAHSNAEAAKILAAIKPLMTDVTGFGLARHALDLAERCGFGGVEIFLDQLPLLPGTRQLMAAGHRSSLHEANKASVPIVDDRSDGIAGGGASDGGDGGAIAAVAAGTSTGASVGAVTGASANSDIGAGTNPQGRNIPHADIIFDPQTSGGLLAAVPRAGARDIMAVLEKNGLQAVAVGRLVDGFAGVALTRVRT